MTFYYDKIFNIIEFWLFGLVIIFPIIMALVKTAKLGDEGNKLIEKEKNK